MAGDKDDYDALRREVETLRARVAELQRAAARHDDTEAGLLALREELLREAERVAHLGTWTWEPATGRVTWSDEMYRILGFALGSVEPSVETFFAAVHPEDRGRAQAATEQSLRDGVLPLVDVRIVRPDGSLRHTTASSSMLFDQTGVPRRIVGGVLDRTESLAAEAKLRRAFSLMEEAQRFAKLGSWRFSPATRELEWSNEFRRIACQPLDAPPSLERFVERVVPEQQQGVRDLLRRAETALQEGAVDLTLITPEGERRLVRVESFVVEGSDGRAELRGTLLDVTEDVKLREDLAHARKMEAIGRLAGGIAHDFNNLLTVITGSLHLLGAKIGPRPEIDNAQQAVASAAMLTRRLLTFGRKVPLSRKWIDPNDLVRSTTGMMQRLVGDEVKIELELAPELPQVHVDPVEIERALINLVVNARDAMPSGGAVRVTTAVVDAEQGRYVELSVGDQGPGIAEQDRSRVFEPFFTTRASEGGTGLGLATVLGTAEQHGGSARVAGGPHGGSVFTITLPAGERPAQSMRAEGSTREAPPAQSERLQILVIDDQPQVAELLGVLLGGRGHAAHVLCDPHKALQLWATHASEFDLVICDIAMAGMRGPDLVKQMMLDDKRCPVLFITGYSEEAAGSDLGYPVLAKPFTSAALERAIRDALVTR